MAISCTCSIATGMCKLKDTHTTACRFNSTEVTFHETIALSQLHDNNKWRDTEMTGYIGIFDLQ